MSSQSHIIKKQVFHLELDSPSAEGRKLQELVSEIYRLRMVPAMERLFDRLSGEEEYITIHRLDLDLGAVSPDRLEDELPDKIEEALFRELGDRIASARADARRRAEGEIPGAAARDPDLEMSTRTDSKIRTVTWFLRTGQLPWNAPGRTSGGTFAEVFGELLRETKEGLAAVLQEELRHAVQRDRFICQCSDVMVADALTACVDSGVFRPVRREASKRLIHLVPELTAVLNERRVLEPWSRGRVRTAVWERTVESLFSGFGTVSSSTGEWLKSAVAQIMGSCLGETGGSVADRRARLSRLGGGSGDLKIDRELREIVAEAVEDLVKETGGDRTDGWYDSGEGKNEKAESAGDETDEGRINRNPESSDRDSSGNSSEKNPKGDSPGSTGGSEIPPGSTGENRSHLPGDPVQGPDGESGLFTNGSHRVNGVKASGNGHRTDLPEKDLRKEGKTGPDSLSSGRDHLNPLVREGYAGNAGLVILHPFLPQLFTQLALVEEKRFVSVEAKQRAVYLLQWLAAREQEAPEEELLLNKLLCGLEPEIPVPAGIEITPDEIEECENLLNNVVRHWDALKNSSPEAIRSTFLRREGLIGREGFSGGWKVILERTTFDVLLDRLPWGISMIKLPWNPWLIHVEW